MKYRVSGGVKLRGTIAVPGDKSISHRAVMIGSLAEGPTRIENFLMGADCLSTIRCFRAMGIEINIEKDNIVTLVGKGLRGLQEPGDILDVGNSGTTIRLMTGILSGQPFFSSVTGDESIRKRPMDRVTIPLTRMGAHIWGRENGRLAPLAIKGGELYPIDFVSPVASAQVKSAVLLAGLFASGQTRVEEPVKSRDHTERMLRYFGADIEVEGNRISVTGFPELTGREVRVPGDISSAAFFIVAGLTTPGSELMLREVGLNPTRDGIIDVLRQMGGRIEILNEREVAGEPVGDILVESSLLRGVEIDGAIIPRLIDEIPVLAVAAAVADGETVIRDAAELKVKETNRIATVTMELAKFGVEVDELPDGLRIKGGKKLQAAFCDSHGDHRIAMAMAVAGLVAEGETTIDGWEAADVSFPNFGELLEKIAR
ncbi:3-phosphoshikimate 1-carboxyvinyltransferase [Thermincola ferriacetica]|uniref:3-phosphoshikimate 1-carboxyvinyltransferase n=1 Tax=Thermincola ferriacetica TaxID=281456 RepID=A0A0L6VYP4_9FIRM|nr:3-phosphoshikimate 1-carboxyvinyltransferase [Thermincola ferriacetica]KNZ68346.1 3-phosphoshikimate 1-carboxyvinyltransferase [Thermincola ferriacetica]